MAGDAHEPWATCGGGGRPLCLHGRHERLDLVHRHQRLHRGLAGDAGDQEVLADALAVAAALPTVRAEVLLHRQPLGRHPLPRPLLPPAARPHRRGGQLHADARVRDPAVGGGRISPSGTSNSCGVARAQLRRGNPDRDRPLPGARKCGPGQGREGLEHAGRPMGPLLAARGQGPAAARGLAASARPGVAGRPHEHSGGVR
mmetsp:Transcript_20862/g.58868  ORF Transcript_20862/g.58868 Transcript_20862/m.58868 type:complete len:201 (+) Transcript_20862:2790-3392(+)